MNGSRSGGAAAAAVAVVLALSACGISSEAMRPDPVPGADKAANADGRPDRAVIKSAWMHLLREDPTSGVREAEAIATRMGGYASASSMEATTLMVPAPKLEEALGALAKLGQVEQRDVRARDVTEARADLELRLANFRKSRERYLEILSRATTVPETLAVEKELERITLEIERLEAALQQMNQLVQLATVDVQFAKPVRPGPVGWVLYGVFSAVKWLFVWN
ncbi:MAG TPA: DUF4349 domain-containing protein [Myxococcales bacterium]|nr:DUF4349 domain-containing protein [Myxococcales bacterium]